MDGKSAAYWIAGRTTYSVTARRALADLSVEDPALVLDRARRWMRQTLALFFREEEEDGDHPVKTLLVATEACRKFNPALEWRLLVTDIYRAPVPEHMRANASVFVFRRWNAIEQIAEELAELKRLPAERVLGILGITA
jgi:hypothetical protein